ncbi:hypothetical protein [Candidatus Clostridium radicumherbarum]|uniref:Uncharacterized protein n=1 Tax=Candidatus Clostridium radicumherbarum TaxID=3381662 RepID=A0ABW8TM76_9CLOT
MSFFWKLSTKILVVLFIFRAMLPFSFAQNFSKANVGTNGAIITSVKVDQNSVIIQNQRKFVQFNYSYIDFFYKTVFLAIAYFSIKSIIIYREPIIDLRTKIYIFKSPILYGSNCIIKPSFFE